MIANWYETPAQAAPPAECEANCAPDRPVRLSWAKLLKRVFDLDLEHCPNCGGELEVIASILEQPVIEEILMTWDCRPGHPLGRLLAARPCKRPERSQPPSIERSGATGRGDGLRQGFAGPMESA